jgi:hypothetical protein
MIETLITLDYADSGDDSASTDSLTVYAITADWQLGWREPQACGVAPHGIASITVDNRDGRFSPQTLQTADPIAKQLRVYTDDGSTRSLQFCGRIVRVTPQTGTWGSRTAVITAHTFDAELSAFTADLALQSDITADSVIAQILDHAPIKRANAGAIWQLGDSALGALNTSATLADSLPVTVRLESGISRFAALCLDDSSAHAALDRVVSAERGRWFVAHDGAGVFHNRHHDLKPAAPVATLTDAFDHAVYHYGDHTNQVQVITTPHRVGTPNSAIWSLPHVRMLPRGETVIHARYASDQGAVTLAQRVRAITLAVNTRADGSGSAVPASLSLAHAGAQAFTVRVYHAGASDAFLTALTVYGDPLFAADPVISTHSDAISITRHGVAGRTLDLTLIDTLLGGDDLARFELNRQPMPRGVITQIVLNASQHPALTHDLRLFDVLRVIDTHTAHDALYTICGLAHTVDRGGFRHMLTCTLSPLFADRFWALGTSALDQTSRAGY